MSDIDVFMVNWSQLSLGLGFNCMNSISCMAVILDAILNKFLTHLSSANVVFTYWQK